jgi:cytochrome c oxidase assembly factor CtaG
MRWSELFVLLDAIKCGSSTFLWQRATHVCAACSGKIALIDTSVSVIVSFYSVFTQFVGRDTSVGIATRYGLDGPGIEYR